MGPTPIQEPTPTSPSMPFSTWTPEGAYGPHTVKRPGTPDERRQCMRRELCCNLLLIDDIMSDSANASTIPGRCLDVSDGGLYATVPLGYGVTIGQRFTFRILVAERGPEPGAVQVVSQQGFIVRTELLIGQDEDGDRLGIGVKLSGHRSGLVPMPAW